MAKLLFNHRLAEFSLLLHDLQQSSGLEEVIEDAINCLYESLVNGRPILICGNGGSASDALHISGELVGRFLRDRKAFNVICLNANVAVLTAWSNDFDYNTVFSRQVEAHGSEGGVLWVLSTSGNSKNILEACKKASEIGMSTMALTGLGGGLLSSVVDLLIEVSSSHTPRVQELHLLIYHYICEKLENRLFA